MRKGTLEFFVLMVISAEPAHGYRIASQLRASTLFEPGEGTLYPLLKRLTNRGAIVPEWETGESGAARKIYRITAEGKKELNAMSDFWERLDAVRKELGG